MSRSTDLHREVLRALITDSAASTTLDNPSVRRRFPHPGHASHERWVRSPIGVESKTFEPGPNIPKALAPES